MPHKRLERRPIERPAKRQRVSEQSYRNLFDQGQNDLRGLPGNGDTGSTGKNEQRNLYAHEYRSAPEQKHGMDLKMRWVKGKGPEEQRLMPGRGADLLSWQGAIGEIRQKISHGILETAKATLHKNAPEVDKLVHWNIQDHVMDLEMRWAREHPGALPRNGESIDKRIHLAEKTVIMLEDHLDKLHQMGNDIIVDQINKLSSIKSSWSTEYYNTLRSKALKIDDRAVREYHLERFRRQDVWWRYCDLTKKQLLAQAAVQGTEIYASMGNIWRELQATVDFYRRLKLQKRALEDLTRSRNSGSEGARKVLYERVSPSRKRQHPE